MAGAKRGSDAYIAAQKKWRKSMLEKYGSQEELSAHFRKLGSIGGKSRKEPGGFASLKKGKDGLTGPERAVIAGYKGGRIRRRVKVENKDERLSN